ncbi:MAG: mechanosensitive ion channel family protein [Phycisphaerae bacterium]
MTQIAQTASTIAIATAILLGAAAVGIVVNALLFALLSRTVPRSDGAFARQLVRHCRWPGFLLVALLGLLLAGPQVEMSVAARVVFQRGLALVFIAALYWLALTSARALSAAIEIRYSPEVDDSVRARRLQTQIRLLNRIVLAILAVVAVGAMLMTFPRVRQVGVSLLASAGVIGLVLGIAAQRTLANVVAGLMIAFTQPIRLEDVVIVEEEWGRIEEITLTYVVVRIWDLRRLIVPVTYFVEKPFQNWTRISPDLLGKAFLYLDFNAPISRLREQLQRICEQSELWDGKLCELQVVEATETSIQVRALASAASSSIAWNLRCEIREKLVAWIRANCPEALPRTRLVGGAFGEGDGPIVDAPAAGTPDTSTGEAT